MPVDVLVTRWSQQGLPSFVRDLQTARGALEDFEGVKDRIGDRLTIGGGAAAGALALVSKRALDVRGSFESVEVGIKGVVGSTDAAKTKIAELKKFAKDSPQFKFIDTARGFQQIAQAERPIEKVMEDLKGIGNALAFAGRGNEELKGATIAYSQILNKQTVSLEEIRQLEERGLPASRILRKELGLTADQMKNLGNEGIDAGKAIDALTRGFNREFAGAMEAQSKTLLGGVAAYEDARDQFLDAAGKSIAPMATDLLRTITVKLEGLETFTEANPVIAKMGLLVGGVGATALVASGQILKWRHTILATAAAKKTLEAATIADDIAEKAKTLTAGKEGKAIGAMGDAAQEAAEKVSLLEKAKSLAAKPFKVGGLPMGQVGGGVVSNGLAAGSAALGVAAGAGAYDDYKTLGLNQAEALAAGAFTGVGAAAVSMFVPGGVVAVALGTGLRYAFNELVNRPMEREAEAGNGLDPASLAGKSNAEKSALYFAQRDKLLATGDEGDAASAGSALIMANSYRKRQKQQQDNAWRTKADSEFSAMNAERDEKARLEGRASRKFSSVDTADVQRHDNGAQVITFQARIPQGPGDKLARERNYNLRTATPNLAM